MAHVGRREMESAGEEPEQLLHGVEAISWDVEAHAFRGYCMCGEFETTLLGSVALIGAEFDAHFDDISET